MSKKTILTKSEIKEDFLKLSGYLKSMDIPKFRKRDIRWLGRNLQVRNSDNKYFENSMNIIKKFLKNGIVHVKNI
jgi:hypothetical protein